MSNSATFWDGIAAKYIAAPMRNTAAYEEWLAEVKAELKETDSVLELGCGSGNTALRLAPLVAQYTATDFAANMVAHGTSAAAEAGIENLTFRQTNPENSDMGGPYDAVLAFNLLHLFEDRPAALANIYEHTKPGRLFISKTMALGKLWPLKLPLAIGKALGKAPHLDFLSERALDKAITDAGFEIVTARNIPARSMNRLIIAQRP